MTINYEQDIQEASAAAGTDQKFVERVATLVERYNQLLLDVAEQEKEIARAKQEANEIARIELPELLAEVGLTEVTTADGTKVEIMRAVNAAITEDRRQAAHKWLIDNGFSGLIKAQVKVEFERGSAEAATAFTEQAVAQGLSASLVNSVHPATLKSFVKEQMEAGNPIPQDLFGVFVFTEAKIKNQRRTR